MAEQGSQLDTLAGDYLRRYAGLHPVAAVSMGLTGAADTLTDYGPEGSAARADLARHLLAQVAAAPAPATERDRIAAESITGRLTLELDEYAAGDWMRALQVIGSPFQSVRRVFDLIPHATVADWEAVAARLEQVPWSLATYRAALAEGVTQEVLAARRQALACGAQAAAIADGYFRGYVAGAPGGRLGERLTAAAAAAETAYAELAAYLRGDYCAAASPADAAGRERYERACRRSTGTVPDLEDTYAWGWDELRRIQAEMAMVADRVLPGGGVDGAIEFLQTSPDRAVEGIDALIGWLQQLMDSAVDALAGTHFDIPGPVRTVEAHIAPPGQAAAMYYTRPSADFSRPGRTWYPDPGQSRFPLWMEVSTAYHEGVPGHHLQLAYTTWLGDRLNPFQRHLGQVTAHTEGWALYAERLMGELGFLENPDYLLGMLASHAFRAARVVTDIGLHLGLRFPADQPYHPGELWTPQLAVPFMVANGRRPAAFMASEVDRYLGWPAQAISYKVGERAWLSVREQVRRREGAGFDLRRFHRRAFGLGMVGLAQLERELTGD